MVAGGGAPAIVPKWPPGSAPLALAFSSRVVKGPAPFGRPTSLIYIRGQGLLAIFQKRVHN